MEIDSIIESWEEMSGVEIPGKIFRFEAWETVGIVCGRIPTASDYEKLGYDISKW
jgi:hypothetical protein